MERKWVWIGLLSGICWGCGDSGAERERQQQRADSMTSVITPLEPEVPLSKAVNNLVVSEEVRFTAKNTDQKQLVEQYRQSMNSIDEIYKTNASRIELYIKLAGKNKPLRVKNFDKAPGGLESSYNLYRDEKGAVRFVLSSPFNESGDWLNTFTHYFDENGRTFAFVRTSNFMNSACTKGAASEISAYFFDQNQQLIQKMYELKGSDGKPLQPDSCVFNYRYPYHIFPSRDSLLLSLHLQ
jgi:hypothetical protein